MTRPAGKTAEAARVYYLAPALSGPIKSWDAQFERIAAMGFSHVLIVWPFGGAAGDPFGTIDLDRFQFDRQMPTAEALTHLADGTARSGLKLCLDLVIDRAAADGALAAALHGCWRSQKLPWADPRTIETDGLVKADFDDPEAQRRLVSFWQERLVEWVAAGVAGVRCHDAQAVDFVVWREILGPVRDKGSDFLAIGWMPGSPRHALADAGQVFDLVPSSVAWWDGRAPWLIEEYEALSGKARLIGFPDDPFGKRLAARASSARSQAAHRLALATATNMADAWLMPMGFEFGTPRGFLDSGVGPDGFEAMRAEAAFDLSSEITSANAAMASRGAAPQSFTMLTGEGAPTTVILRSRVAVRDKEAAESELIVFNPDLARLANVPLAALAAKAGMRLAAPGATLDLPEGGAVTAALAPAEPVRAVGTARAPDVASPRIAIEAVAPVLDGGRFPVKRVAGDIVIVEADIFADGHEVLAAQVLWRAEDETDWSRAPLVYLVNDRWRGSFPLLRTGRHVFAIEAWWSHFGTFARDLTKKRDAGLDLTLEIAEGRILLEEALAKGEGDVHAIIADHLRALEEAGADGAAVLLAPALATAMEAADTRPFSTGRDMIYPVEADRRAGAFSSWYELFPRSITDDPSRHGTFRDVIGRLPAVKAMGFDVLYFPPIHPIGKTNRKGPNNTLTPGPNDPGSPYAIGSPDGGHEAIHPELGSREDFRTLVKEAAAHGLEIALDFAIQCSPDHPWLKQHPGWFQWRPDGSMKYAENPPKKYQDIVNVDFYGPDAEPALWLELRDVVQGWVDEGVRIFRVDNPHTKPFPFWEWLIADIRSRDPGVLFLAEAFTRPKVMYRLGKVGFSQSYTYFTWRNTKAELTEYLTELNQAPARDLFRPHFFVNTPDINPVFLQTSGRSGFLIRAALAATLSGLWGVYSGFELCEAAPMPGKEEYLDSEKYELRPRDWQMPGNIIAEITALNAIRRSHPALQSHLGLTFYNAFNDQVLFYGKRVPGDRDMVLVAVSLDPQGAQAATIELPLWEFGLPDSGSVTVDDLMHGNRFAWTGKTQTIQLTPDQPFAIWRLTPTGAASA